MLGFLFTAEDQFGVDPEAGASTLTQEAGPVLATAHQALSELAAWTAADIEATLRAALVDGLGLKPRAAFSGALRVAVTGSRAGPPLFQSLELLGRDRTLDRLARARAIAAPA